MTAYETFVADPGRVDVFLAELTYGVQESRATTYTLRYATAKYAGPFSTDDTPDEVYAARMAEEIRWGSAVLTPDAVGIQLPETQGQIAIVNTDGSLDAARLDGWLWDGRPCVVRHVGYSPRLKRWLTVAEGRTILKGEIEQVLVDDALLRVIYRDHREKLKQPLCPRKFAGGTWCKPLASADINLGTTTTAAKLNVTGPITIGARLMVTTSGQNYLLTWSNSTLTDVAFAVTVRAADVRFIHIKASTTYAVNLTALNPTGYLGEWCKLWITISGTAVSGYLERERTGVWTSDTGALADGTRASTTAGNTCRIGGSVGLTAAGLVIDWLQVWNGALSQDRCVELSKILDAQERLSADLLYYTDLEEGTGTAIADKSPAPLEDGTSSDSVWYRNLGGGDELAGTSPGEVVGPGTRRVPCILVDGLANHYSVCSDQLGDTTGVSLDEGGGAVTISATYTSFASYAAASAPGAGNAYLLNCPAGVFVRTNAAPTKPLALTIPASGQTSVGLGSAPSGPGAIARNLLVDRGGFASADLDEDSFTDLDNEWGAAVGHYAAPVATLGQTIDAILGSVGAVLVRLRSGLIAARRVRNPDGGPVAVTLDQRHISPPRPVPTMLPVSRTIVTWSPNWTPLNASQQAAGLTAAQQMAVEQPAKRINRPRAGDRHPLGREVSRQTSLSVQSAAEQLASRIESIGRDYGWSYEVDVTSRGFLADLLDVVEITYSLPDQQTGVPASRVFHELGERFLVMGAQDSPAGPTLTLWRVGVPGVLVDTSVTWLADPDGQVLLMVG